MTPTKPLGRELLEAAIDGATEAEADQGRHRMEEAILSTLSKAGPADPFRFTFDKAYCAGILTFTRSDLRNIAEAVWALVCKKGIVADATLVLDAMREAGVSAPDAVLSDILSGSKAVDTTVAGEYIKKLAAFDLRRRVQEAVREFSKRVEGLKDAEDLDTAVACLTKDFFDLAHREKLVREYQTEYEAAAGFLDKLAARRADGRRWLGLDCGFNHLNEVLNGLGEGLFILAGAPSTGKTTLAKQIADTVAATEKVPVLFWTFEQSAEALRIKSLARLASVDTRLIWKGRGDTNTWAKVEEAAETYRRGPGKWLTVIEAGLTDTVKAIRAAALMAKHQAGDKPVLLVLDFLQIVPAGPDAPETVRERVDFVLSELRRLARDLKSPVLVVSSQNREGYRDNKKPSLAALKESGGIEYSADAVLCLWRNNKQSELMTKKYGRKTIRVELYVLKNREGELAKVELDFTPAWALFTEAGSEDLGYDAALGNSD